MMNFVTNARDAMPDGGLLTIKTSVYDMDDGYVRSHGYGKPGKYAQIAVSDTGVGMDERTRERIFEPFFTTKPAGKGTGLGLSIVYGIVKQHNGFVNCFSGPGKGTVFHVLLPLVSREAEEVRKKRSTTPRGGTETILIADDDEDIRKLTELVLRGAGYTVISARDGVEAVDRFGENAGKVDLLLLDVIMPRKSGKEAFEEIRAAAPGIRTIFMSGYSEDVIQRKRIREEGLPYIVKPTTPRELLSKVREVLDRN